MKKIFILFAIFISASSFADGESFSGRGHCFIETYPCKDGQTISCSAEGLNGGFCLASKKRKYYEVECVAFGDHRYGTRTSRVRKSCKYR